MKVYYSVQNYISDKWIYDCIISVLSVNAHNQGVQFLIYYDTEETKSMLEKYLINLNVTYIKDEWTENFAQSLPQKTHWLGNGVYNLFHAIQNDEDFFFFDTDVFCYSKIEIPQTDKNMVCIRNHHRLPTRAAVYVKQVEMGKRLENLSFEYLDFFDESIMYKRFMDITEIKQIKGIAHFSNTELLQKGKYADKKLFEQLLPKVGNLTSYEFLNYIKGLDE